MNIGDIAVVNENITLVEEGEEKFTGQKVKIVTKDNFCFPIGVKFMDNEIQKEYEKMGSRRFDEFELTIK